MPLSKRSPTLSATLCVWDFERWLSSTGPGSGQSKPSLKEWIQYLARFSPNVDVSSMSRVLSSLHLDLPRNLPDIRQLIPNNSFPQLRQIFHRTDRLRGDKKEQNSSKQLSGVDSEQNTECSSFTDTEGTPVHIPVQVNCDEKQVYDKVKETTDSNEKISVQKHVVRHSDTATAHESSILTTTSSAQVTDSVLSKVNTVASGIARQIADYMPTVDVNTITQTKSQQPQESLESSKRKTKPSEVTKETSVIQKPSVIRRQLVTRGSIDRQTRGLVLCLRDARTSTSQLVRLEELCQHVAQYPDCTGVAVKVCIISYMFCSVLFSGLVN